MGAEKYQRLESLDVLRGFDLFCLVALEVILYPLEGAVTAPWFHSIMWGFTHVEWEGFSSWDLVMPLFMFMSGVSIPFALSRYKSMPDKKTVIFRLFKRVLLLWIFGMICQGNLLALNPHKIYLYSNTLQAIAMGYLVAAVLFLYVKPRTQVLVAISFLLIYWGAMELISYNGYGNGLYTPDANLAEIIDRLVLGRFRDAATVINGEVLFAEWYRYTWILSSLNFVVTVLTGVFAGQILKSNIAQNKKAYILFVIGILMVILGWIWGIDHPVIKKIWTSSMVLVSSGYCFLLMSVFYYWVDYKGKRRGLTWLKVYGMNSIAAYMLTMVINFRCIGESVFFGLQQYLGNYYQVWIAICNVVVIYIILYWLYTKKIFLKV